MYDQILVLGDYFSKVYGVQRGLEQRGFLCLEKSALLKNALYKANIM